MAFLNMAGTEVSHSVSEACAKHIEGAHAPPHPCARCLFKTNQSDVPLQNARHIPLAHPSFFPVPQACPIHIAQRTRPKQLVRFDIYIINAPRFDPRMGAGALGPVRPACSSPRCCCRFRPCMGERGRSNPRRGDSSVTYPSLLVGGSFDARNGACPSSGWDFLHRRGQPRLPQ